MSDARALTVYVIAGEASGDLLGAHAMHALKVRSPDMCFHGIGGPRMQEAGLKSLFPYDELSLMGFAEVVPHVLKLSARIQQTVDDIHAKQPDLVLTIDSPGFCFRVVERLRKEGFPAKFVHYVAPTVWIYKPERAAKCARLFDHLLVLLPFEPPYFEKENLPTTFVGHPVVVETKTGDGAAFRQKYDIKPETTLLCLLPGSRKSEIRRHMPVFARTVALLAPHFNDLAMAVAVPKAMLPHVAPYFKNCPFRAVVTANEEDKKNAIAAANLAITKSGTVTLEIAMSGTSMIVSHRMNPLSVWLFRRMTTVKYVNLINVLADREIVPELLQEHCTPPLLASAAFQLLNDAARVQRQKDAYRTELAKLRGPGGAMPSQIVADRILQLLNR